MGLVYYNENDPHAAAWLRELIKNGLIPAGDVDERSIEDVRPIDIDHYNQCHFFAGIGGWAYALDLAGWSRDRPVWTGSCPCQPFSAAGKGVGFADQRHLWPAWQHLLAQCKPSVVFGEQVASKHADAWIDLVHADMEGMGYAFGCVPFPAAGVGAPHIRDRNYWLADLCSQELPQRISDGRVQRETMGASQGEAANGGCLVGRLADSDCRTGGQGHALDGGRYSRGGALARAGLGGGGVPDGERPGPVNGFWRAADWLACTDGKWRPVEPGTQPLAHGLPARVGRLRGYGNAIVPQQAAEFVRAYIEARGFGVMEAAA